VERVKEKVKEKEDLILEVVLISILEEKAKVKVKVTEDLISK